MEVHTYKYGISTSLAIPLHCFFYLLRVPMLLTLVPTKIKTEAIPTHSLLTDGGHLITDHDDDQCPVAASHQIG